MKQNRKLQSDRAYVSPDGALKLLVVHSDDDVPLGFDGASAHTHADILAELLGQSEDAAAESYIQALLADRSVICISTVDGKVANVWIADDDPEKALRYKPDNESIDFRYWSGATYRPKKLL